MNLIKAKFKEHKIRKIIDKSCIFFGYQVSLNPARLNLNLNSKLVDDHKLVPLIKTKFDSQILVKIIKNRGVDLKSSLWIVESKNNWPNWIDIKDVEEFVVKANYARIAYYCAKCLPEINIEKMEDVIITDSIRDWKFCDIDMCLLFAKNISGANTQRIQNCILNWGDTKRIVSFANEVENADLVGIGYYLIKEAKYNEFKSIQSKLDPASKVDLILKIIDSENYEMCRWINEHLEMSGYHKDMLEFAMKAYEKVTIKEECEVIKHNEHNKI